MGKKISKNLTEKWKKIDFESPLKKYAVSNLGRMASYTDALYKDGEEILLNKSERGYRFLPKLAADKNGKRATKSFKVHRLIATAFVKNTSKLRDVVTHINHNVYDNKATNLKWVTRLELSAHTKTKKTNKTVVSKKESTKNVLLKKAIINKSTSKKSTVKSTLIRRK